MAATINCPACGKGNPIDLDTCQWCHKPMSSVGQNPPARESATKRYAEAYIVARVVTKFGSTVKILAVVAAALIVVVGLTIGVQEEAALTGLFGGLVAGFTVGIPFYVLGILLAAVGQILKATLDTAVHTSPILTPDEMQRAMSIY